MSSQENRDPKGRTSLRTRLGEHWRAGRRRRIEELVDDVAALSRDQLLDLIEGEVDLREADGDAVDVDEYLARFPFIEQALRGWFGARSHAGSRFALATTMDRGEASGEESSATRDGEQDETRRHGKIAVGKPSDAMPKTIGRYVVERRLGQGGFGVVYLARDPELERMVAIKVPRRLGSERQIATFLEEARAAAKLRHPGVVAVHDVQRKDGIIFIVQDYLSGGTLAELLAKETPREVQLAKMIARIADALSHAHRQGVVHRDLKPANILLDENQNPQIVDFGLAIDDRLQQHRQGEVAGTCLYMSPEQVRGDADLLDGRTDIWSLGVIFYQGLAGQLPFSGKSSYEICREIETRDPKPPRMIDPSISGELESICLRCLAKRSSDRYSTASDIHSELTSWALKQTAAVDYGSGVLTALLAVGDSQSGSTALVPTGKEISVEVREGPHQGERYLIAEGQSLVFGRTSRAQVVMQGNPRLSSIHFQLTHKASGQIEIEDLGSTNGTLIHRDGELVTLRARRARLRPGEQFKAGDSLFAVKVDST